MKKFYLQILLLSLIISALVVCVYAQSSSINKQTKQLSNVKKNIRLKEAEAKKLLQREKTVKRDLDFINKIIKDTEKKLLTISANIIVAEKNLHIASTNYDTASANQDTWKQSLLDELIAFEKMSVMLSYNKDPFEHKTREVLLKHKRKNLDKEKQQVDISSSDIRKWETSKNDLMKLNREQNRLIEERKKLLNEKNNLLQTTSKRRIAAQKEIRELNESAREMQSLIARLARQQRLKEEQEQKRAQEQASKSKKKTSIKPVSSMSAKKPATISRASSGKKKAVQRQRKSLPWPVSGQVVASFGRSRHPDLDTFVISNGIKIKAANNSNVKAVDSGMVVFTGKFRSYGNVVIVEHSNFFSVYGQLAEINVRDNQNVQMGSVIAKLGRDQGSILYFEIRQGDSPDNAIFWLKR